MPIQDTRDSVTFHDGRTFKPGDRVKFSTKYGTDGAGTVLGFGRDGGATTVKIQPDADAEYRGRYDRWPLKGGGFYERIPNVGIFGGEITHSAEEWRAELNAPRARAYPFADSCERVSK